MARAIPVKIEDLEGPGPGVEMPQRPGVPNQCGLLGVGHRDLPGGQEDVAEEQDDQEGDEGVEQVVALDELRQGVEDVVPQ
jgi:hypothetical protein